MQQTSKQAIKEGSRGMAEGSGRKKPNILVTGTPGTGKTTTSSLLAESTQLHHINIGDLVRDNNLHDGWDDHFDCHIINEDLVFDRVVVLQTENSVLYDRLTKRGYTGSKLTNNMECEIFQVLLEEAKDSYPEDIVVPLKSDNVDDINRNIATLTDWVGSWCPKP